MTRHVPRSRLSVTTLLGGCVALLCGLASSPAQAVSVYLNGVNIDGVTGQSFENCSVSIDEKGNVLITAKGYEVQRQTPNAAKATTAAAPATPVTKHYFLVTETSAPGKVQYDVDIFVNATWIKRIAANDGQVILDISKHLRQGKNTVHFTAVKNLKEGRKSVSAGDYLKIHVGEGSMGGNNVMIDNPLIEYTRTAAELDNVDQEFTITGR